jgi:hypothetical protein
MTVRTILPDQPRKAVRQRRCGLCGVPRGVPCTSRGDHLARWLAAYDDREISRGDLKTVIVRLVIITKWAVVDEALIGRAA